MSEHSFDYVLLGNSTAAIAAVEAIRGIDHTSTIAVVSDQMAHCYCSPLITYVLAGKIPEERINYRPRDIYRKLDVTTYLGRTATSVDPEAHTVTLADGLQLTYRKLLLATGGTPIVPDLPGAELDGVFSFTRYDDMARVRDFINTHKVRQAVVVGAGMIGVKVAEAFAYMGLETTVVELRERVLVLALDEVGSEMAGAAMADHGIRVITSSAATSIGGSNGLVQSVTLDSGSRLPAQLVIMAVGVRPNIKLAQQARISVNRGVLVDAHLRTSHPDVYAAGDVAEAYDPLTGEPRPLAIWPAAYLQGEVAGRNMAGVEATYEGSIAMNSIQVCDLPTIAVGLTAPPGPVETLEYRSPDGRSYRRIVLDGDRVVGAVFVGDVDRAGIITGLIRSGMGVAGFKEKLIQRDLGLLSLPKQYRKHIVKGPGIEV